MSRHTNRTKKWYLLIPLFIVLISIIISLPWIKRTLTPPATKTDVNMSPIIMIPGSDANINVLDGLINNVDTRYKEHHSVLKVTVGTDNKLTYSGNLQAKDKTPFIVVGFENNQDGWKNIKKQAVWFNIAFKDLQKRYHFKTFNAFGHSNGSLIWTYFLEDNFAQYNVQLKHLMTVGAPYNFSETNHDDRTKMLEQLIKNKDSIPKSLSYYSIAGTEKYADDGIVPLSSVDAGKYIYQDQIKHYMFITLTGENAQHSDMLTNPQFITLFHQFIIKSSEKMTQMNIK